MLFAGPRKGQLFWQSANVLTATKYDLFLYELKLTKNILKGKRLKIELTLEHTVPKSFHTFESTFFLSYKTPFNFDFIFWQMMKKLIEYTQVDLNTLKKF